ncbi:hypothetical protein [uncultured Sphingorhabdus sp.]|uniref:hypothetical protein n=1 Tax=uncultured Sphingorhabdus sp. TaxID=1686106 RepID=UPI00260CD0FD|nr:hypothetical protein [uncultured Sphingorhabdus sp.]HMS20526.1 hypothetical protein [Sphingorhabdus sp.]
MRRSSPIALLTLSFSASLLTSCASLGGNIKGDFLCRAPGGSCAPSIVIDDQALAQIGEARPMPASQTSPWNMPKQSVPQVAQAGNGVVNAPPRVTQVVFPAFVDSNGYLHEARKVKMVSQAGGWVQIADAAPTPVGGALAAAQTNNEMSGFKLAAEPVAVSISTSVIDPNAPSAEAVAQARQKAALKQPTTPEQIKAVVEAKLVGPPSPSSASSGTPVNKPAGFSGKVD